MADYTSGNTGVQIDAAVDGFQALVGAGYNGLITVGTNGGGNSLGALISRGATANLYEAFDGTKTMIVGTDAANSYVKMGSLTSHPVAFVVGNGERMRLDASGNLLVGKTAADGGVVGFEARPGGEVYANVGAVSGAGIALTGASSPKVSVTATGGSTAIVASDGAASYFGSSTNNPVKFRTNNVDHMILDTSGNLLAGVDNTQTLGGASNRWSVVYAGTGTINTSDAREKTAVSALTANEVEASKQLGKEIGTYKWLAAVAEKGDAARTHIGMTVQRAIEIMTANNLDPMAYGFICYDSWDDVFVDHPAIEAQEAVIAQEATEDSPAVEAQEAVEAVAAWTEQTQTAGDRYGFRYDELLAFIVAGFNARLEALEAV